MVPRLFDATSGAVRVDGVDVRELDPEQLWRRIGLVPQRPYLFSGTVASNLRYGNPDATDDELWAALEIAQGRDFVAAMPDGLDAPIAQGGTNVSGGQRQRLAIARALVRRPGDLPVRRRVLGAGPDHRRPAAGRAAPGDRDRDRGDRRPAGVHHRRRRPDRGAGGRRGGRRRPAPRAARLLPDLPGDRRVAARRRRRWREHLHRAAASRTPRRPPRPAGWPSSAAAAGRGAAWASRRRSR